QAATGAPQRLTRVAPVSTASLHDHECRRRRQSCRAAARVDWRHGTADRKPACGHRDTGSCSRVSHVRPRMDRASMPVRLLRTMAGNHTNSPMARTRRALMLTCAALAGATAADAEEETLQSEFLLDLALTTESPTIVGFPGGERAIVRITGGSFEGPRL